MECIRTFAEIRTRDVIRRQLGAPTESVQFVSPQIRDDLMSFQLSVEEDVSVTHIARPEESVILVHRPWPEGKTGQDLLADIAALAQQVAGLLDTSSRQSVYDHITDPAPTLAALREALEAYELGKPQESRQ